MNGLGTMIFPLVIIGGMMFFMTRSQKKQQNQRQELLNNMKAGDEIVTIGGLYGVVHEVNTDKGTVVIDCEGIYLEFERNAIKTVKEGTTATPAPVQETEVVEEVETTIVEEEKENQ
ncbi:preprotein translocase subunit YajC [Vagococcus carniphilus]|uniref:Preprotein translocase subunit YajC n=1 Tax=Vagococcus carniphilus TaxID=218144 RepID=A0AAW8U2Z6_9ENTE|nr:preprotein translocase subunit YajC [Vagococcus carniphilus]MDT2813472.1 preprotein translocase subunit YajC [Vagococcus carniphilus]MDT2830076.1 preprotein translocase subunit YajC [Vagococcus carniphilus]MDT2833960.1 preprotein translocase subunit YajC [Vagococcus carniphilus]MDT2838509.1 preprotein translocase subunit YajC [Vagococcus carniphilus]MDT2848109.1 preprotein translocase subunit YajC [Vagococcus carniphilus]